MIHNEDPLETSKTDMLVWGGKAILNVLIPGIGQYCGEILSLIVPQRMDRIVDHIRGMEGTLSALPLELLNQIKNNPEFVELFNESIEMATKAATENRQEYILQIMQKGITEEAIAYQESKRLLHILNELTDAEIIWLRYYLTTVMDPDYNSIHSDVLKVVREFRGDGDYSRTKSAFQQSYTENLLRLNLLRPKYDINNKTGLLEVDAVTKEPKIKGYQVTTMGKVFLKHIGVIPELDYLPERDCVSVYQKNEE